ncbi:hypothetical protein TcasGA2_TC004576 [Tribolium castaneum]|uniref:Uncharacterized protein n=1 Tax=Tribolium castaneum TaxID=7070 RepID=D6WBG4_TRICA|nr:hypothetical protein TcasGA2_TC004576 [Tribolium castaneum]
MCHWFFSKPLSFGDPLFGHPKCSTLYSLPTFVKCFAKVGYYQNTASFKILSVLCFAPTDPIQEFQLNSLTYGIACCPYLVLRDVLPTLVLLTLSTLIKSQAQAYQITPSNHSRTKRSLLSELARVFDPGRLDSVGMILLLMT